MTEVLAGFGWALAGLATVLVLALRRRLERVASAEHELRGPATVLCLAAERLRRDPATGGHARALEAEVERLRAGLADLSAARRGRRPASRPSAIEVEPLARSALAGWEPALRSARLDWRAGAAAARADRGRLAQLLGNLLANAAEHGDGRVEMSGRRSPTGLRLEVRNPVKRDGQGKHARERGRGLAIAARAAREAGGKLDLSVRDGAAVAAVELPLEPAPPQPERSRGAPSGQRPDAT